MAISLPEGSPSASLNSVILPHRSPDSGCFALIFQSNVLISNIFNIVGYLNGCHDWSLYQIDGTGKENPQYTGSKRWVPFKKHHLVASQNQTQILGDYIFHYLWMSS